MSLQSNKKTVKRTFWTVAAFYSLIAFEFFYMASPFAFYFYSAYRPGLSILNEISGLAWLSSFFLPHIVVETSSTLINLHNFIGLIFSILGFLLFLYSAGQVYYYKITKKGAVTGGLYRIIRHPQYSSFILCSFGLLLLWPRFLVLVMFVTILFAYYFLARVEERECEDKFGSSYLQYKNKTQMFVPFRFTGLTKIFDLLHLKSTKVIAFIGVYILTISISLLLARGLQSLSIASLYTFQKENAVYLSVSKMDKNELEEIANLALNNKDVQQRLITVNKGEVQFLNYIVPANWSISEIPMNPIDPDSSDPSKHFLRTANNNEHIYKIIFTTVEIPENIQLAGNDIFRKTVIRNPVLEVWLDLNIKQIVDIKSPPKKVRYENIPVPVF